MWNVFPKGMFIDNIVEVAKKELAWEVDYIREAECTRKFKLALASYPEYFVPDVIGKQCYVLVSLYHHFATRNQSFEILNKCRTADALRFDLEV